MKKNLIYNYIWKNNIFENQDIFIYLNSLKNINNCHKVLFFEDVNEINLNKIKMYYDEIIESPIIDKTRYVELDYLLVNQNKFDYILYSDMRDVIFQLDPFDFMKNNGKDLYLISEGMKVIESIPNHNWMFDLSKTMKSNNKLYFMDSVINAGVFGGKQKDFINLLINMITMMDRNSSNPIMDQTVLSYLNHFLKHLSSVKICDPRESNFCLTGEGVDKHNVNFSYDKNLNFYDKSNSLFYIVHQWDRTILANSIRDSFKRYDGNL